MTDAQRDTDRREGAATPGWVKLLAIMGLGLVLLAVVVMLLGGGQHGPGLHAAAGVSGTPGTSASAAGGGGGPAPAIEAQRVIAVATLDTMVFEPDAIQVSRGETVTFRVTNAGQAVHEFTVGDAAMQQEHADAMAHMPGGMPHDLPNSIRIEPGEAKELTWRFGDAAVLEYACHEPGHYEAGMRGRITVS